jgi:hypothetical protein
VDTHAFYPALMIFTLSISLDSAASFVRSRRAQSSRPARTEDGFHSERSLNRVDSNTATHNTGNGFFLPNGSNYLTRKTASGSTGTGGNGDYNFTTATKMGPIGNLSTATSPWANFR